MKAKIYSILAAVAMIAAGCTDEDIVQTGLEGQEQGKRLYYLNATVTANPQTRTTEIEGLTKKELTPRFELGDVIEVRGSLPQTDISYIPAITGTSDIKKTYKFTMKCYETDSEGKPTTTEVTDPTTHDGDMAYLFTCEENISEEFTPDSAVVLATQIDNGINTHLRKSIINPAKIGVDAIGTDITRVKPITFKVEPYAIVKIIMAGFKYPIWGGSKLKFIRYEGPKEGQKIQLLSRGILGNTPTVKTDKKLLDGKTYKAPEVTDTQKPLVAVPVKGVQIDGVDQTGDFAEYTDWYIGSSDNYKLTAYIAVKAGTTIPAGEYLKTEILGGWSGDLYVWRKQIPNGVTFESGKMYVIDYSEIEPDFGINAMDQYAENIIINSKGHYKKGNEIPNYTVDGQIIKKDDDFDFDTTPIIWDKCHHSSGWDTIKLNNNIMIDITYNNYKKNPTN